MVLSRIFHQIQFKNKKIKKKRLQNFAPTKKRKEKENFHGSTVKSLEPIPVSTTSIKIQQISVQ